MGILLNCCKGSSRRLSMKSCCILGIVAFESLLAGQEIWTRIRSEYLSDSRGEND